MTEYLTSRKDRWTDWLPQRTQDTINQSPLINTLMRMYNSQPADLRLPAMRDGPGNTSIDRIAESRSSLAKEYPQPWHPAAEQAVNTTGFLANFIGPGARLPTPPKPQGIKAYHGSPHDFDRFDISKIGTGEGAQAYGRGLYFAEAEGVAKSYRDILTNDKSGLGRSDRYIVNGQPATPTENEAIKWLKAWGHDTAIDELSHLKLEPRNAGRATEIDDQIAALMRFKNTSAQITEAPPSQGRMYEVRINADPEQFLDWDKPLAQQPEAVKKNYLDALGRLGNPNPSGVEKSPFASSGEGLENLLNAWSKYDREKASNALREAGIPGIKYLDQGSRAAGQGSRNYVVFDDKLIEILRKYGLLPPIAAGAAASQSQEPPL